MQVFTVGSLTLDIFLQPENQEVFTQNGKEFISFELGSKIRVKNVKEMFGGSSANAAVSLRRFGVGNVACVGAVGDDEVARDVLANLKHEKISTKFVNALSGERTGFSVIVNSAQGRHTALFNPGANHAFSRLDPKIFHACDALHLGRLSGNACKTFEMIRKFFKRYPEKFLSWNPGNEQLDKGIKHFHDFLPCVDILFLNAEEAEKFTGTKAKNSKTSQAKNLAPIFKKIFANRFRGICVITDGPRGAQACDGKKIYFSPAYTKFKLVDTLGAGDAFASTFLAAQILGQDIPTSLKFAGINSASVVSRFGTQPGLLPFSKVKKLTKNMRVSEMKI